MWRNRLWSRTTTSPRDMLFICFKKCNLRGLKFGTRIEQSEVQERLFLAQKPNLGPDRLIVEVPISHSITLTHTHIHTATSGSTRLSDWPAHRSGRYPHNTLPTQHATNTTRYQHNTLPTQHATNTTRHKHNTLPTQHATNSRSPRRYWKPRTQQ